jgi:hypothetical protein
MTSQEELRVLQMVYDGVISAAEAGHLLEALGNQPSGKPVEITGVTEVPAARSHRHLKQAPLIAGCVVTALGATLLALAYAGQVGRGLLVVGYVLLVPGVFLALLGFWLLRAAWVRVRINDPQRGGRPIRIYLPVPLTLAAWAVRLARPFVHDPDMTGLDEVILALRDAVRSRQVMSVVVNDGEDGEHVEVSVG